MGVLIMKRDTNGGTQYLKNLCRYIKFDRKAGAVRDDFVTALGFGVDCFDMDEAYYQMLQVRRFYGKESGNPLIHFIYAFDTKVKRQEEAIRLSAKIMAYFQSHYQILVGMHRKYDKDANCMRYHIHLIINSVSYMNGKMISTWKTEIEDFRLYIQNVTGSLTAFHFAETTDDIAGTLHKK